QDQDEHVRHQWAPFPAGRAWRTACHFNGVQVGQSLTDSVPNIERASALPSTLARRASEQPELPSGCGRAALTVFPSIVPLAVLRAESRLKTRPLPDCEMFSSESCMAERDFAQGPAASTVSAANFQLPSTDIGAASPRPAFKTPTNPSSGRPTRKIYATRNLRFV